MVYNYNSITSVASIKSVTFRLIFHLILVYLYCTNIDAKLFHLELEHNINYLHNKLRMFCLQSNCSLLVNFPKVGYTLHF